MTNLRQKPNGEQFDGQDEIPLPQPGRHLPPRHAQEGIFRHWPNRAKSNGCIRVEDYRRLANWLFGHDVAPSAATPEQHMSLPRGVPVYVTYLTMVPDATGMATFADRYGWDRPGALGRRHGCRPRLGSARRVVRAAAARRRVGQLAAIRLLSLPVSWGRAGPRSMAARVSSASLLVTG